MAAELFVDTSAWYPLVLRAHPQHRPLAAALEEAVRGGARVVTTNLVVAETHALLLRRTSRHTALAFVRVVAEPPNLLVHSNTELEAAALAEWLERYQDQDFSFTDAVSFAVMAQRRIGRALALDHHFAIAGFRVLPS